MHFQIYIPKAKDLASELARVGLADFVQNAEVIPEPEGPDGTGGAIFAWWNPRCRQIGYRPVEQRWINAETYWIGFWNAENPTPQELARPYQEPGKMLRMGDGQSWLLPTLDRLDKSLILADDGTWRFEVQRRHHQLWLDSLEWAKRFEPTIGNDRKVEVNFGDVADFVVGVLRLNYRLTREVVSELRLLSIETLQQAFSAIVGFPVAMGVADGQ